MIECARQLKEQYPTIGAIVLECVQMPPFGEAVHHATGLPTYDLYTLGKWFYSGLVREPFAPWTEEELSSKDNVFPRESHAKIESDL